MDIKDEYIIKYKRRFSKPKKRMGTEKESPYGDTDARKIFKRRNEEIIEEKWKKLAELRGYKLDNKLQ